MPQLLKQEGYMPNAAIGLHPELYEYLAIRPRSCLNAGGVSMRAYSTCVTVCTQEGYMPKATIG